MFFPSTELIYVLIFFFLMCQLIIIEKYQIIRFCKNNIASKFGCIYTWNIYVTYSASEVGDRMG